jgi:hypothetical protein
VDLQPSDVGDAGRAHTSRRLGRWCACACEGRRGAIARVLTVRSRLVCLPATGFLLLASCYCLPATAFLPRICAARMCSARICSSSCAHDGQYTRLAPTAATPAAVYCPRHSLLPSSCSPPIRTCAALCSTSTRSMLLVRTPPLDKGDGGNRNNAAPTDAAEVEATSAGLSTKTGWWPPLRCSLRPRSVTSYPKVLTVSQSASSKGRRWAPYTLCAFHTTASSPTGTERKNKPVCGRMYCST